MYGYGDITAIYVALISNIKILERFQSKALHMIADAP
jgi:hypothetical protein